MKIARYVGELLFDYECVVIPGLGGFIAEDKSVTVNKVTDKFSPPYRKIHFNLHLRANDGLLVNFVAQQENIDYKVAKQRVDKFVFLCKNALDAGKKINFKHIGSIYNDPEKNIVFDQDHSINYNAESFGMSSLVSPSIRRVSDEEKVKRVVKSAIDNTKPKKSSERVDRTPKVETKPATRTMQANRRKSPLINQITFLAVVMFFMGLGYAYMRRDAMKYYFNKYSLHIPFLYSSVNDYLASNINSTHVAKLSRGTASFFPFVLNKNDQQSIENQEIVVVDDNKLNEEPVVVLSEEVITLPAVNNVEMEEIPEETKVIIKDPEPVNDAEPIVNEVIRSKKKNAVPDESNTVSNSPTNRFFIIAGSFSKESNAKSYVNELKSMGYKAMIADTNKYGMFRVAFTSFNNRAVADRQLLAIREDANPKAWLLVK